MVFFFAPLPLLSCPYNPFSPDAQLWLSVVLVLVRKVLLRPFLLWVVPCVHLVLDMCWALVIMAFLPVPGSMLRLSLLAFFTFASAKEIPCVLSLPAHPVRLTFLALIT